MLRPRPRALVPYLALTALVSLHCSSSGSSDDDDDGGTANGGESGEPTAGGSAGRAGASSGGHSGKGGSGTSGGTGGDLAAGAAGLDGGSSGQSEGGAGATPSNAGAGGTSVHGHAGEATSGTGGNGATGGSAGENGSLDCSAGGGLAIVPEAGTMADTGWVSASTNCMGVSGPISVTHDEASSITLDSVDGRICVSGHVDKGPSAVADRSSGARISIQLNNPTNAATPLQYDALDEGVHGYQFTFTGPSVPPEIRPTFHILGTETDYCRRICAAGLEAALFNVSDAYCWDGTGALQTGVGLLALEFAIPANESAAFDFDFCIEDILGMTGNASVGDPGTCG